MAEALDNFLEKLFNWNEPGSIRTTQTLLGIFKHLLIQITLSNCAVHKIWRTDVSRIGYRAGAEKTASAGVFE